MTTLGGELSSVEKNEVADQIKKTVTSLK